MAVVSLSSPLSHFPFKFTISMLWHWQPRPFSTTIPCAVRKAEEATRMVTLKNDNDSLQICRVANGLWQTSGGWGHIDHDAAVNAMLRYADAGLSTFDMSNHCISNAYTGFDSFKFLVWRKFFFGFWVYILFCRWTCRRFVWYLHQ